MCVIEFVCCANCVYNEYACMKSCTHECLCVFRSMCMCIHVGVRVCACVHTCGHVSIYVNHCECVFACVHMCVPFTVSEHVYLYVYMCIVHTCVYTYVCENCCVSELCLSSKLNTVSETWEYPFLGLRYPQSLELPAFRCGPQLQEKRPRDSLLCLSQRAHLTHSSGGKQVPTPTHVWLHPSLQANLPAL